MSKNEKRNKKIYFDIQSSIFFSKNEIKNMIYFDIQSSIFFRWFKVNIEL